MQPNNSRGTSPYSPQDSSLEVQPVVLENYDPSAGSLNQPLAEVPPVDSAYHRRQIKKWVRWGVGAVAAVTIVAVIFPIVLMNVRRGDDPSQGNTSQLPTSNLDPAETYELTINGEVKINGVLTMQPIGQPTGATSGQIYFDADSNNLFLYNGDQFVQLLTEEDQAAVVSGVVSVQGATGNVTFTAGTGIALSGTTISNSGILNLNGTDAQVQVSTVNGTSTLSLPQSIAASSSPTFAGLTVDNIVSASALSIGSGAQQFSLLGSSASTVLIQNGGSATTISFAAPSADRSIVFPDDSGTVCLSSGNCGGGGGGAPTTASYLTLAVNGTLSAERVLTEGTNINFTDGGANGALTVAVVGNPTFSGAIVAASFSGDGSALTALNASNLSSGTVASGRLSGSYTGVTGTGALDAGSITSNFGAIDIGSDTITSGLINGQTISSTANLSGTLTVTGLTTLNGGLTVEAGDTFTFNGDAFTDLTGTGLTINTGSLQTTLGTSVDLASAEVTGTLAVGNGGTGAITSQAAINNLSQLTTDGDLLYFNGTNSTRLARGSDTQCLTSNATTILWGSCGGGGGAGTLQEAYDGGSSITTTDNRNIVFNLANTTTDSDFVINLQGTGNVFEIQDNTNPIFWIDDTGTIDYRPADNSLALEVRNTSNALVFVIDTLNNQIGVNRVTRNSDSDTYIDFLDDRLTVVAGGQEFLDLQEVAGQDILYVANGGDVDLNIDAGTLVVDAGTNAVDVTGTLAVSGNANLNANTTIGNATSDRLTVISELLGASPLVFQGATDNGFATTLAFTDPTATNTITFPDASGTIQLAPASGSYILQVPPSTAANTITPTANSVVGLTVNATSGTSARAVVINQSQTSTALEVNDNHTTGANTAIIDIIKNGAGSTGYMLRLLQVTGTVSNGIYMQGTIGTGINLSGATISTDIINATNFIVSTAGNITAGGTYNTNTFTSSNLTFGAASAATIQSASGQNLLVQSQGAGVLTVTSGSGTIALGSATLQRSGTALTIDVNNASNSTLTIDNVGAGNITLTVGDGTNNFTFSNATGPVYAGTARPTKTVQLTPEYPGLTLTPDGSNNNGTLTSDFCSGSSRLSVNTSICGATDEHNYFTWTTDQGSAQDYDIYVRYQLPADFAAFISDTTIKMYGWRTTSSDKVEFSAYRSTATATTQCGSTTEVNSSNTTWQQTSMTGSETGCSFAAGDNLLFKIKVTGTNGSFARAGEINFDYYAKF